MKKRWFLTLIASIPVAAAVLAIQSCGGVGGPTTGNPAIGGGSASEEFLALLSPEQKASSSISAEECAACHGGRGPDDPIYAHWKDTVHATKGVTCESCHGPGGAHKANPTKDNILTFPKLASSAVCAQCHGPINDQFNYSKHSKFIDHPVEDAATNPANYGRNSRCIACHSGLTRAQYVEQGVDLGTLTDEQIIKLSSDTITVVPHSVDCVTCHNPHKKTGLLTANGEEAQLRHPVSNTDTSAIAPGTSAASFTTFDHLCAQCHNGRGADPSDAKLATSTSRPMHASVQMQMLMGFGAVEGPAPVERNTAHAQVPGQCSKCHLPDARHTFTVSYDKSCAPCHTAADPRRGSAAPGTAARPP
jgi:formate-dependent nitrite reductase cytochrome c552 subunit